MGLTTALLYMSEAGNWRAVEARSADDLPMLDTRPLLAVRVEDSDSCLLVGRDPAGNEWSWVFGEPAALGFAPFRPWLPSVDPDDLDDTLSARALAVAGDIRAWAASSGLGDLEQVRVADALLAPHVFAEDGWHQLRSLFGLDAVEAVWVEKDEPDLASIYARARRPRAPRAIALDHASPGWRRLNATDLLGRFGEPACLLEWQGTWYLASDPPLTLFGCEESLLSGRTGATGRLVPIPPGNAATLNEAADWARANVGTAGPALVEGRPPLLLEVIDHELDARLPDLRKAQEWELHEVAPPMKAGLMAAWSASTPECAADALALAHDRVLAVMPRHVGRERATTRSDVVDG
jgi:hypothetical protein